MELTGQQIREMVTKYLERAKALLDEPFSPNGGDKRFDDAASLTNYVNGLDDLSPVGHPRRDCNREILASEKRRICPAPGIWFGGGRDCREKLRILQTVRVAFKSPTQGS